MKEIPFNDFLAKYQVGEIQVVDVREQEEYDALHLDGVTLLPLSVLAERYSELDTVLRSTAPDVFPASVSMVNAVISSTTHLSAFIQTCIALTRQFWDTLFLPAA